MITTVWILWLWFVPFNATMDTRFTTIPIHRTPEFTTKKECELEKLTLAPTLAALWPDEKANVESIQIHCIPKQVMQ